MINNLTLVILNGNFTVCKLPSDAEIPSWAIGSFTSVSRTEDELSIVCNDNEVPDDIESEKDWKCFKVEGPLAFSLTGILADLSTALTKANVSIFAVSTFDTDYILVKKEKLEEAMKALQASGHTVTYT